MTNLPVATAANLTKLGFAALAGCIVWMGFDLRHAKAARELKVMKQEMITLASELSLALSFDESPCPNEVRISPEYLRRTHKQLGSFSKSPETLLPALNKLNSLGVDIYIAPDHCGEKIYQTYGRIVAYRVVDAHRPNKTLFSVARSGRVIEETSAN